MSISNLNNEKRDLEIKLKEKSDQYEIRKSLSQTQIEFQLKLSESTQKNVELLTEIKNKETEFETYKIKTKSEIDTLNKEINTLNEKNLIYNNLITDYNNLKINYENLEKKYNQLLSNTNNNKNNSNDNCKNKIKNKFEEREIEIFKNENAVLKNKINELNNIINELNKNLKQNETIINKYKSKELLKDDISIIQSYDDVPNNNMTMFFDMDFGENKAYQNYKIEKNETIFINNNLKKEENKRISNVSNQLNSKVKSLNYDDNNIIIAEKHYFTLSGGDLLYKKIQILDDTILKNRTMYEEILNDYENKISMLKNKILELEKTHSEEMSNIKSNYENQIEKILQEKNSNLSDELIKIKEDNNKIVENLQNSMIAKNTEKDKEIEGLNTKIKELLNEFKNERELRIKENDDCRNYYEKLKQNLVDDNQKMKQQLEEIPQLYQQIENMKNSDKRNKQKINQLNEKVIYFDRTNRELTTKLSKAENKLNSDPYYAKEIMSKTLFNFAFKIMNEK